MGEAEIILRVCISREFNLAPIERVASFMGAANRSRDLAQKAFESTHGSNGSLALRYQDALEFLGEEGLTHKEQGEIIAMCLSSGALNGGDGPHSIAEALGYSRTAVNWALKASHVAAARHLDIGPDQAQLLWVDSSELLESGKIR